jgi:CBS-domain-containing membrane protein
MQATDVMTTNVITVGPDAELRQIVDLLLKHRISAVPVVDDERRVLGIVSRANLLHGLAVKGVAKPSVSPDDRSLRATLLKALPEKAGVDTAFVNVIVDGGAVELWGIVDSEEQGRAAELAARETPGVKSVRNRLGQVPPWIWAE